MKTKTFQVDTASLVYHRMRCGYTQAELADKIDVNKYSVFCWENDKAKIHRDNLEKLCFVLGVFADELLSDYAKSIIRDHKVNIMRQTDEMLRGERDVDIRTSTGLIDKLEGNSNSIHAILDIKPTPAENQREEWLKDDDEV